MRADIAVASKTRVGIVGGGILGLTLALRLAKLGHYVEVFEAGAELGGLAASHDYGSFFWDRFYHCILPQDRHLIGLLRDLGLGSELRWRETGTGYYARGRWFPMSKSSDYLKFPLLSWIDKARVGATVIYATLAADPMKLYSVSAEQWLTRWCGRRGYEVFWRPLLRAKFGPFYDQVAAVFIWATLTRLFGARSGAASKETLGYVRGGYRAVLGRFESELSVLGAVVRKSSPVRSIRRCPWGTPEGGGAATVRSPSRGCEIHYGRGAMTDRATFDHVFFTGPTRLARSIVDPALLPIVARAESEHPAAAAYLGVACLVLAMKRRLTPFYVLNVGDESVELTGVIEMTNLVDRDAETAGLSLVYVPQYMDSSDPRLLVDDGVIEKGLVDRGLLRMFPDVSRREFVYHRVHRTKFVQPLPLVRHGPPPHAPQGAVLISRTTPLQILNTSMLTCATLNNDEVVAFVDRFVEIHGGLGAPGAEKGSSTVRPIEVFPRAVTRAS
jgi:protoporphyrinogen oxidase